MEVVAAFVVAVVEVAAVISVVDVVDEWKLLFLS